MNRKVCLYGCHQAIALFMGIWLVTALFSACSSDDEGAIKHPGKLSLVLTADTTSWPKVSAKTKSIGNEFADFTTVESYSVDILKGENVIHHFKRYDEMPESVVLEEGSYVLKAYRGKNEPYALLNPYFEGSVDFSIKEGMSTPLDITCKLANARVTVEYSDDFKEAYPTYSLLMNTEFMKDTLTYAQAENRPAYLKTGSEGTELNLLLRYVKIEEDEIRELTPNPIAIEPQQRVHLLFKTDGEALSGIGLEVTLNNSMDGDSTLNVTIPDYTYKPVTAPTITPANFVSGTDLTPTYTDLSNKTQSYSATYVVPATVGSCWLTMKSTIGDKTQTTSLDLAKAADLSTAKSLGFEIRSGENELSSVHKTKTGTIYFDEVLAKLPPQKVDAHFEYTLQVADTLPIPTKSEIITLSVKPIKVEKSSYESTFDDVSYEIVDGNDIAKTESVAFKTSSGFKTAELKVQMKQGTTETTKIYNFVADELPRGITFNKETNALTFDKSFVRYLPMVIGSRDDARYTLTVNAVDRMDDVITKEPLKMNIKITPVIELLVPSEDAWAWKAKLELTASGLQYIENPSDLKFLVSKDGSSYTECSGKYDLNANKATIWAKGLDINLEKYVVKVEYKGTLVFSGLITKEKAKQIENGNIEYWTMDKRVCTYGYGSNTLGTGSKLNIPYPNTNFWVTNNSTTAKDVYLNASLNPFSQPGAESIPSGCFPTVVYEVKNNGKAAIIRSIDASNKNKKGRGELSFNSDFTSRPSSMSFEYAYEALGDEVFVSDIKLLGEGDRVVAKGSRPNTAGASTDYTACTIPLIYELNDVLVVKITIMFASANTTEPQYATKTITTIDPEKVSSNDTYSYQGVRAGSTLKIDNVILNYREE